MLESAFTARLDGLADQNSLPIQGLSPGHGLGWRIRHDILWSAPLVQMFCLQTFLCTHVLFSEIMVSSG